MINLIYTEIYYKKYLVKVKFNTMLFHNKEIISEGQICSYHAI